MKLDVLDLVKILLKKFVEMIRPDVGEIVLRGDVLDGNLALSDKLTNVEPSRDVFRERTVRAVPDDMKCRRIVDMWRHVCRTLCRSLGRSVCWIKT